MDGKLSPAAGRAVKAIPPRKTPPPQWETPARRPNPIEAAALTPRGCD